MVTALRLQMNERLLWDIPEIFDTKDGGPANFKKIIMTILTHAEVWRMSRKSVRDALFWKKKRF